MWQRSGESVRDFMFEGECPMAERRLQLTPVLGRRLLSAMHKLAQNETVNCHKFSRIMSGEPLRNNAEDEEPLIERPNVDTAVTRLALGQVGVISTEIGVWHSVVGLGPENPESLQVMSINGELGLCSLASTRDFYERLFAQEAQLHAVPHMGMAA